MHYINPKGKFILSPQEQRQGPRFKVSSEGLSAEIDKPQRSPIQVQTKVKVVQVHLEEKICICYGPQEKSSTQRSILGFQVNRLMVPLKHFH